MRTTHQTCRKRCLYRAPSHFLWLPTGLSREAWCCRRLCDFGCIFRLPQRREDVVVGPLVCFLERPVAVSHRKPAG